MKSFFQALIRAITSRLARNIYFWLLLIYSRLEFSYTPARRLLTAVLFGWLAVLFYTNNLLLVPRLLSKKKYLWYGVAYSVLTLLVAIGYTATLKLALYHYPGLEGWMISPLTMETETPELTGYALLREMPAYYCMLFISGGIFAMSWYVTDYRELQRRMEAANSRHLQAELAFLKNQINPHFLFNTLNNLYTLTVKKSDGAPEVVDRLSTILRYFLYESNTESISIEKEKEMMQAYITLELLRLSNQQGLHFSFQIEEPCSIPPLLWVPVLENVFKHGTRFAGNDYEVDFRFSVVKGMLRIYSENTCRTVDAPSVEGIGLSNLRKRLELLYPGRHQIRSGPEGRYSVTEVNIRLV